MRSNEAEERIVLDVAARSDGIVVVGDLRAAGLPTAGVARLRRAGMLVPLGRGLDRVANQPFGLRSRYRATLAVAGSGAVLGLRSAGRVHGLPGYADADDVVVLAVRTRPAPLTRFGRILRVPELDPDDVDVVDGLPVTSRARTERDLGVATGAR